MADKNTNFTDTANDDALTTDAVAPGAEPATAHDTKEGGILGAVGGAVVGMLAGGPIGAVIGAVAGGAASAAAVNVVDRHDHDYAQTVGTTIDGATAPIGTTTGNAYAPDTAVTGAYPASTATTTGYGTSNLAQNTGVTGASQGTVIPIVEEELVVGKQQVESGGARIRTGVVETPVSEQVTLREEHVNVTRRAVDEPVMDGAATFKEQSFDVVETDEVPVVSKSARVVEEVVVGKTATERTETVHDTVRRTDVEMDELGPDGNTRR